MSMESISEEAIADVLEIEPATLRRWLSRAEVNFINQLFEI